MPRSPSPTSRTRRPAYEHRSAGGGPATATCAAARSAPGRRPVQPRTVHNRRPRVVHHERAEESGPFLKLCMDSWTQGLRDSGTQGLRDSGDFGQAFDFLGSPARRVGELQEIEKVHYKMWSTSPYSRHCRASSVTRVRCRLSIMSFGSRVRSRSVRLTASSVVVVLSTMSCIML